MEYHYNLQRFHLVLMTPSKTSPPDVFLRKGVLKMGSKITGEHRCQSVISINCFSCWYILEAKIFQPKVCNFTKSNTHLWVFFTFFKLCKWYQIAQRITMV